MSTILQVENLSRSYGEKNLFEKISFVISQGQKVALIARNGAGKTSLLNIIAGLEQSDGGTVTIFNPGAFEYLPQDPALNDRNTVFTEVFSHSNEIQKVIMNYEKVMKGGDKKEIEKAISQMDAINGWEYETRIRQILSILKLPDLDQPVSGLSGGQKKRVALAKVLITEPQFMILDEPTNHLDVEMVEWLEEYFSRNYLTILMVTHDRYFLERVCDEILEMEDAAIFRYRGNYSYFLEKQSERIDSRNKEIDRARNLLRTEQEWMRRMPKARTTKSKARIDSFYEIREVASERIREEQITIPVEGARIGKKILEINDVDFNWGNLKILTGFTHTFKRNEKVGIIGKNGTGKSTFLDIITGKLRPRRGSVVKGETIQFGYYTQEGLAFNEQTRVIDMVKEIADVVRIGNGDTISAAAFLNYFMFPYPSHQQPVYKLSGGEKRRLYLVTVLMKSPNFLILDEPTNDLDIFALNLLEEYLASFNGCVAVVSHDRFFLDKIVDHMFVFEGEGKIKDFPGNYTQYREYSDLKKRKAMLLRRNAPAKPVKGKPAGPGKSGLSYKEQKEIESLESDILTLESEKAAIEKLFSTASLKQEELVIKSKRLALILNEIESKTGKWIELTEKSIEN